MHLSKSIAFDVFFLLLLCYSMSLLQLNGIQFPIDTMLEELCGKKYRKPHKFPDQVQHKDSKLVDLTL